jgi:hypothetical protein
MLASRRTVSSSRMIGGVILSLMTVAERSLDALTKLLMGNSVKTIRAVIPIFSTIYPVIFKLLYVSLPP